MYAPQNPIDELKRFFARKSVLNKLIIINVAVFVLVNIVNLMLWLFRVQSRPDTIQDISLFAYYFAVPSDISALLLRPWTIFTYMFLQEDFFHIFFNMIVLYFGGRIFMEYMSDRKLLSTYILGGIVGAFFYIVAFNIFPVFNESVYVSVALGASASVLAILIAAATYVPDYTVTLFLFGKVKLKHLAIAVVIIDLLSITRGNSGGHLAHLGGAFWGFLYISLMKKGTNLTLNLGNMDFKRFFKFFTKSKKTTSYQTHTSSSRPINDEDYNYNKKKDQEKIDLILEKISRSGYNSLTKEEKALLFKSSTKSQK